MAAACSDAAKTTAQVKLHQSATKDSAVLASISKGATLKISDCNNGWCRTSWNGREGYILAKNVQIGRSNRPVEPDRADEDDEEERSIPDAGGEIGPND